MSENGILFKLTCCLVFTFPESPTSLGRLTHVPYESLGRPPLSQLLPGTPPPRSPSVLPSPMSLLSHLLRFSSSILNSLASFSFSYFISLSLRTFVFSPPELLFFPPFTLPLPFLSFFTPSTSFPALLFPNSPSLLSLLPFQLFCPLLLPHSSPAYLFPCSSLSLNLAPPFPSGSRHRQRRRQQRLHHLLLYLQQRQRRRQCLHHQPHHGRHHHY